MEALKKVTSRLGGPQAPSRFSLASILLIASESERIRAERFWTCSQIDRPASIVGTGVLQPQRVEISPYCHLHCIPSLTAAR